MASPSIPAIHTSGRKKARIEIIPLIDVVFFLLATFVLFTLSLDKILSVPATLPVSGPPQPPGPDEPAVIQVSEGDTIYFMRDSISIHEVESRLFSYKQSAKTPRVIVTGDDRGKVGTLIQVLDIVRKTDIQQVAVETDYRASGR